MKPKYEWRVKVHRSPYDGTPGSNSWFSREGAPLEPPDDRDGWRPQVIAYAADLFVLWERHEAWGEKGANPTG